jgi:hypothetical protein
VLAAVLAGCGGSQLVRDGSTSEGAVFASILAALPEHHRGNVVYIDREGRIYSHPPELKAQVRAARRVGVGLSAWPDGTTFVDPDADFGPSGGPNPTPTPPSGWLPPPCSVEAGAGAFRRVLSFPGSGPEWFPFRYAAFSAHIYLPDPALNQIHIADPRRETAYIYTGGWGEQPTSTVDAGFQYNAPTRTWALVYKLHGQRPLPLVDVARLVPGQYVLLQFYVVLDDHVAVYAEGLWTDGFFGRRGDGISVVSWRGDGLKNRLKRVTTVAQKPRNDRSGTYVLGVHWFRTALGRSLNSLRPWTSADTAEECRVPPDRVTVQPDSAGDEYVSIDLR